MSSVTLSKKEYDELYDMNATLLEMIENPMKYKEYFEDELDQGKLFDVMKEGIVKYAKENTIFFNYLKEQLFPQLSVKESKKSEKINLKPLNTFSPRSSSRPSLPY